MRVEVIFGWGIGSTNASVGAQFIGGGRLSYPLKDVNAKRTWLIPSF
jgi:hypothetical protein